MHQFYSSYKWHFLFYFSLIFFGISIASVDAQDVYNATTGSICNNTSGTIRLKTNNSKFRNGAPYVNISNTGTFEFNSTTQTFTDYSGLTTGTALGFSTALRVPGTVLYSGTTGSQNLQMRYYTNLSLSSSSTKSIADGIYVSASYSTGANTGARSYSGTLHYDGTTAQIIASESGSTVGGTNRYGNVSFENGGSKTVSGVVNVDANVLHSASGGLIVVTGGTLSAYTSATASALTTLNGGTFTLGSSTSSFSADVSIIGGGTMNTGSLGGAVTFSGNTTVTSGSLTIPTGSGDVTITTGTLTLAATTGSISVGANRRLTIASTFTNNVAPSSRTNMSFATNSTVYYSNPNSGQVIVAADQYYPYGNIVATSASKSITSNTYMVGNLTVTVTTASIPTQAYVTVSTGATLFMTNANSTISYNTSDEVVGALSRVFATTATQYTFNNAQTLVTFTTGTVPATMTINNQPNTAPLQYSAATDINRKLTLSYTGSSNWQATIRAGYTATENTTGLDETLIRDYQSNVVSATKISTGYLRTNVTTGSLHYVSLQGISGTTATGVLALAKFTSGNDLLLRGGATVFNAIAAGRWSNPGTWDEGAQPGSSDDAAIDGFTVHAGFRRTGIDGTTANGQILEAHPTLLVKNITLSSSANTSLLFGYYATGSLDELNPTFSLTTGGVSTITNGAGNSCTPVTAADLLSARNGVNSGASFGGFLNFEGATIHANTLINTGAISNGGVIEVGD